jgi:hypothetical protein
VDDVWDSMERDMLNALKIHNYNAAEVINELSRTHILFRGSPADDLEGAKNMIKELHQRGKKLIEERKERFTDIDVEKVMDFLDTKMDSARNVVENNITLDEKKLPEVGEFISFQGKRTPL